MANRLSTIDELTRPDHTFLAPDDECYYLGEYAARVGFAFSRTNNLIQNLKKPVDRRGRPEWRWKEEAIRTLGRELREALDPEFLGAATLVPMPPSKHRTDVLYDDRMLRVLFALAGEGKLDIRELVNVRESTDTAHLANERRSVEALVSVLEIDRALAKPEPSILAVFDDVLTTGAHFVAVKRVLQAEFPGARICGIFLARRDPNVDPA